MSSNSAEAGIHLAPVTVRNDLLRVTRELELRGAGLVVTHRISPTGAIPVEFRVVDPLASNLDVDELGFKPAFEPAEGRITAAETIIEGHIEPGYAREVVSGICPADPKPPADVRRLHESVQPAIAKSARWEADPGGQHLPDDPSTTRAARTATSARDRPAGLFGRLKRGLWGGPRETPHEPAGAERRQDSDRGQRDPRREEALELTGDVFPDIEPDAHKSPSPKRHRGDESTVDWAEFWSESSPTGAWRSAQSPSRPRAVEAADETPDESRGTDANVWPNLEFESETITRSTADYRTFAEVFEGLEIGPSDADSIDREDDAELDVVSQLIGRLDGEAWPHEKRWRLAQELLDEPARSNLPEANLDDRIESLEDQVAEISEYTAVVASTIETHGSAEAYLDETTEGLEELDSARRRIRARLEQAGSERESIQDRLETIAENTARLESKLDRLEDRATALRSRHERTFSTYETEAADLETVAAEVVAMEAEVRTLREVLVG